MYRNSTYRTLLLLRDFAEKLLQDKSLRPALRITLLQLRKDIKMVLSFWLNVKQKDSRKKETFSHHNQLQIGGGQHYLRNFVNLDLFPPADIIWDCRYGLPFSKEKFKFVFTEHFLEHLDFPISVKKVLSEIYRILEPNGSLLIGVPDGEKVIRAYSQCNKNFLNKLYRNCYKHRRPPIKVYGELDLVNYLFRDQLDNPNYTIHYWAYDNNSLSNLLKSIGFRIVKKTKFDHRYCNPERKFYTLYVHAVK